MTSVLSYRPSTSGTTGSSNGAILNRQTSLSSFPSTRTPSNSSIRNGAPYTGHIPRIPRRGSVSSSQTPSTSSSTQQTPHRNDVSRPRKKLKSQYPAASSERHVEYILVASFHVDQGPIMEHQYPGAISGDESMLAELMLPDQVHNRKEDWTMFFLHKDQNEEEDRVDREDQETRDGDAGSEGQNGGQGNTAEGDGEANTKTTDTAEDDDDAEGGEGPPLIYVLNLVNTKHDPTVKRFVSIIYHLHWYLSDRGIK